MGTGLNVGVRLSLAAFFFWTAASKLWPQPGPQSPQSLYQQLGGDGWPGYLVIGVELLLAAVLVLLWRRRWTLLVAMISLSAFSGLIAGEMTRENPSLCGCRTVEITPQGPRDVRLALAKSLSANLLLTVVSGIALAVVSGETDRIDAPYRP